MRNKIINSINLFNTAKEIPNSLHKETNETVLNWKEV